MTKRGADFDFVTSLRTSIGDVYDSGAVIHVAYRYVDNSSTTAELEGVLPVLWSVPVQMFYWPEGHIRVEIELIGKAATRPSPTTRPG